MVQYSIVLHFGRCLTLGFKTVKKAAASTGHQLGRHLEKEVLLYVQYVQYVPPYRRRERKRKHQLIAFYSPAVLQYSTTSVLYVLCCVYSLIM